MWAYVPKEIGCVPRCDCIKSRKSTRLDAYSNERDIYNQIMTRNKTVYEIKCKSID